MCVCFVFVCLCLCVVCSVYVRAPRFLGTEAQCAAAGWEVGGENKPIAGVSNSSGSGRCQSLPQRTAAKSPVPSVEISSDIRPHARRRNARTRTQTHTHTHGHTHTPGKAGMAAVAAARPEGSPRPLPATLCTNPCARRPVEVNDACVCLN